VILVLLLFGGCKGNINDGTDVVAVTDRVSLNSEEQEGNDSSDFPAVSGDGRFVAFSSLASNLVAGDTNGFADIFLRDRLLGTTVLVSVGLLGAPANGASFLPSISADGRYVAFQSIASNLVAGDTNGASDVFVRDTVAGTTTMASVTSGGAISTTQLLGSTGAAISADGQYVTFESDATDLVATPNVTGGNGLNVYRHHNVPLGATDLVSINFAGTGSGALDSFFSAVSGDGSFVTFQSSSTNLVSPASNGQQHVFVRDMNAGTMEIASVSSAGVQGNGASEKPSVSSDGTRVVFDSQATNLISIALIPGQSQVYLRDRTVPATTLVSVNLTGIGSTGSSGPATISGNGLYVAFTSAAADLVVGDANNMPDTFWRDLANAVTLRVSVRTYGGESHPIKGPTAAPRLNTDGRYVVFDSSASDLVAGDANSADDAFIRGPLY
jgi:Tol biopolymer transport system component